MTASVESAPPKVAETHVSPGLQREAWLALVAAAILSLFANGRFTIATAAWIAPVFLLHWVRLERPRRGLFVAWLVLAGAWAFQFRGMVPVPGLFYAILAAIYGFVVVLPFVVDRLLHRRIGGVPGTLVLPSAWVATEYLVATFTPYGSWGSVAYTQHENLALLQILSVTGLYGVSFLIGWFASVANFAWEHGFRWPEVRRSVLVFASTLVAVCLFGGARLVLFHPGDSTVRVASLTRPDIDLLEVAAPLMRGQGTPAQREELRRRGEQIDADLLERTEREAAAGAKVLFWGEANAFVFKEDEPELIRRAATIATTYGAYVGVAVGTWNAGRPKPLENKLILIDPNGNVAWETLKAIPVPGGEAAISARDDGRIRSLDTPYGRIGAAICFDMDFPRHLQEAGRADVDLMLVPSNDWRAIDPWHSHMARFRAIEQGFNLVRHTSNGLSIATDATGRVLAAMDHYSTRDRVLVSRLPTRGITTLYSRIGDLFAWLCCASIVILAVVALRRSRAAPELPHPVSGSPGTA